MSAVAGHPGTWRRLRRLRSLLRGIPVSSPVEALRQRDGRMVAAWWLMRAFYLLLFYDAFDMIVRMHNWALKGLTPDPLWIVAWTNLVGIPEATRFLAAGYVVTALLALMYPQYRWARLAVAAFAVSVFALENSFGAFNHHHYYPLWVAVFFVALPSGDLAALRASRAGRECFLAVFFLAQFAIATFYTLSGLYKCLTGFWPGYWPGGNVVSSFAPDALPRLVIARWFEGGERTFLEGLFVRNMWLSWPAYLFVIFLETVAIVIVFRPQLHVVFGFALAVFHVMIWMVMGIRFPYQPVMVAMLFILSPFAPLRMAPAAEMILQVPVLGDLLRLARSRRTQRPRSATA